MLPPSPPPQTLPLGLYQACVGPSWVLPGCHGEARKGPGCMWRLLFWLGNGVGRAHSPLPCPLYLSVIPPPFWSSCVKGFPPHLDSFFLQELLNPLFAPENHRHPPVKEGP